MACGIHSSLIKHYLPRNTQQPENRSVKLTKTQLVDSIQQQLGLSKKQSTQSVETILKILKDTLASGEDVLISNFGKFCVKEKAERKGQNPATGEDLILKARKVVTFRASDRLKEKVDSN